MTNPALLNALAHDAKLVDPFIHNAKKISEPIPCTYCKKIYIGETGRRIGDRFREHLRDVERNDKDVS